MEIPELLPVIYPPNKPLERTLGLSNQPTFYDYMFFVDSNVKGEFILGCSNITGDYWENTLCHYKDAPTTANLDKYSGYYIGPSTSSDAKFIMENKVVLAEDSSCLKIFTIKDNGNPNLLCEEVLITNERVEQLSVWNGSYKVLACAGSAVLIADAQSTATDPIQEFREFHTRHVTAIDTSKNQINIFASASLDRKACLWDDRMDVTASVLFQHEFNGLTSISWNRAHPECLAVGSESGDVYSLDIRQPKEYFCSHSCFKARVHKIVFNNLGHLAVCGDSCDLFVLNANDNFNVVYKNSDHTACVRGLAWLNENLYSCGFDKNVIKHVL